MIVSYTEWQGQEKTRIVDTDSFWINHQQKGFEKADKYWHECMESGEAYCYGRNDPYVSLYHSERGWFKMDKTWIPNDVWKVPNQIFETLLKRHGLW